MEREEVPVFDLNTFEITGKTYRNELTRTDIHGIVCVLVENSEGKIFMQIRSPAKKLYPGAFDLSASGFVRAGETFEEGAARELAEEIGIVVSPSKLREHLVFHGLLSPQEYPCYTFVYKIITDEVISLDNDEVVGGQWFELSELQTKISQNPEDFTRLSPLVLQQVYMC